MITEESMPFTLFCVPKAEACAFGQLDSARRQFRRQDPKLAKQFLKMAHDEMERVTQTRRT